MCRVRLIKYAIMNRIVVIIYLLVAQLPLFSQETFIKSFNLGEFQTARQIVLYEDRIFILVTGVCDLLNECSLYMEIDDQGEILWQKKLKWLDVASKSMVIENDTIFISGNHPSRDRWLWHQMSVDGGDSLATYDVVDTSNIYQLMSNFGTTKWGDRFCIYGSGEMGTYETSLLYLVDSHGRVDTLLDILTTNVDSDPWEVIPDNEGNLVAFIRYREEGKNRQRVVAKINSDKELFWTYFSEENSQQDAVPNGAILEDGTIVYNSREQFNKAEKLRGIGPDSTIVWLHDPTDKTGENRIFLKIHTIGDGSVLGVGRFGNRNVDPSIWDVPWITKIASDESKVWEKAYFAWRENGVDEQLGWFSDAVELNDGSIMALGTIRPVAGQPSETLLCRLDADGCLEPGCGVFNDITSYLTSTNSVVNVDFDIYPNPAAATLNIKMNGLPDKIEIYALSGQLMMVDQNTLIVNIEELQKGIYFIKVYMDGQVGVQEFVKS